MNRNLFKRIQNKLEIFLKTSTAHGLPNIVETKNSFIKLLWILFFLASFGYCTYTLVRSIRQYTDYQTTVQINFARDSTTEFPAVSICNLCSYDVDDFYKLDKGKYLMPIFKELGFLDSDGIIDGIDWSKANQTRPKQYIDFKINEAKVIIASKFKNNATLRKLLGFDFSTQKLLSCSFNKVPCDASDFSYYWSNIYGNCYTFNSGKDASGNDQPILKTSRPGISYGLEMEILIGDYYYEPLFVDQQGLYLVVHNQSTRIHYLYNGVNVATGLNTYIPIKRTFYNKLSQPYSDCIEDMKSYQKLSEYSKTLYNYMENLNITEYNQDFCYRLCFQDYLNKEYNCSSIDVPPVNDIDYCQNENEFSCLSKVNSVFSANLETLCKSSCPTQCYSLKYDLTENVATYPASWYYEQIKRYSLSSQSRNTPYQIIFNSEYLLINKTYRRERVQLVKESIIRVNVNYDDLTYQVINEIPSMNFETLLGFLGGQLSFFIGISLLSIIELLDLLIGIIWTFYRIRSIQNTAITHQTSSYNNEILRY